MCARWQLPVHRDRPRHRRRAPALPLGGRGRRRHARRGARRRAALPARAPSARRRLARAAARGRGRAAPSTIRRLLLRLLAAPNICAKTWVYEQYDQVVGSGTVARPGGDAGVVRLTPSRARDRRGARRRRRARRARPAPRRRRGGRAGGAQRRLQRRRARRDHELPQLRQPRAPGHRLRAARGDHRHGRGLRGARHAGRLGQRLALQRERRPADPPDARRRLRRACSERAALGGADRRRPAASGDALPARRHRDAGLRRLRVAGARRPARRRAASPRSICRRCAGSATCSPSSRARACSRSAHDVSDGGLAVALAEVALAAGTRARGRRSSPASGRGRRRSSASAAASSSSSCAPRATRQRLAEACDAAGVPLERSEPWAARAIAAALRRARARRRRSREARAAYEDALPRRDGGRLMCGVFGIHAPGRDVARLAYFALYALQHRGQESAGIAVSDGRRVLTVRDMGLVAQVFDEGKLQALAGRAAIGHARYSTTGSAHWMNSQPIVAHRPGRTVALGHNGNLTNTERAARGAAGAAACELGSTSDTEVICALIAHHPGHARRGRGARDGAHPRRVLGGRAERGHAARLPRSRRHPAARARRSRRLAGRRLGDAGARHHRRDRRARARAGRAADLRLAGLARRARPCRRGARETMCVFEHIYFARPDAQMDGQTLYAERERMGERLAAEAPAEADVVIPVPDSGTPAAQGYARASGLPFADGLIKNRYVGRTFIQPDQALREHGVRLKFNPLPHVHRGPAAGRRRRLDRARLDDAQDRRRCCATRARARCTCASRRRRSSRPASTASTWPAKDELIAAGRSRRGDPRAARRRLARLPLARGPAARDRAPRRPLLPRLPDGRLPGRRCPRRRRGKLRFEREPARA